MNDKTLHASSHYHGMVVEVENEKLRERVAELEAQLSAIGAGGVEPLRKAAAQPARERLQQSADECTHGTAHLVNDCLRCGAPVCCGKCCADDAALQAAPPAPAGVAVPEALRELIEAIQYTPLGVRAIQAMTRARAALAAAPAQAVDRRTPPDMLVNGGALKLALNVLRRAGKNEVADELEKTAAQAHEDARVQWWLASLDQYGNPTLTDGAHSDRAGADKAAYLIDALGVGQGKKYAVARVELSQPKPSAEGVNHEAVAQCNRAARAAQGDHDE